MEIREKELCKLKDFTQSVEAEVTMLLQSLQWDRKLILEGNSTAPCQYDANHRMPKDKLETHETHCALRNLGYGENDELLPDPPDNEAHTLVKLSNTEIQKIINEASKGDPLFKKGVGGVSHQPLSLSRLQLVYTADERRALHDAVVATVPSCHDLGDLALASTSKGAEPGSAVKSRVEILAELRDMKRRRTKYRVAAKTRNYSDVLRDVIKTQMESYTEAISSTSSKDIVNAKYSQNVDSDHERNNYRSSSKCMKFDGVRISDGKSENSDVDKRLEDRRYRYNGRKESSSRYENRHERANSSNRHESKRQVCRDEPSERYTSRSKHGNSNEKRRHDNEGNARNEKKHAHISNERNDDFDKLDKPKSHDYGHDRYKYDHYKKDKVKVEPRKRSRKSMSRSDFKRHRNSRSKSRESRKRKRGDKDNKRYGCEKSDVQHKRYYDF